MKHLEISIPDNAKIIKLNDLKEVSDPVFFVRDGVPTEKGLLSKEIFGITTEERMNIFGYIDLWHDCFIHPLLYKIWSRTDANLDTIAYGAARFKITDSGKFERNSGGDTGLNFIKKNIDRIKFSGTGSRKRENNIELLRRSIKDGTMFMRYFLVCPAYYRDINSEKGYVGIGEINKLYSSLIVAVNSLKSATDYGLDMSNAVYGRVQRIMVDIYDWFTKGSQDSGAGLSGKWGIVRRSVQSKTSDYATRAVMSAPNYRVERFEDMPVNLEYSGIPLAAVCANMNPFMVYHIKRFFDNEFALSSTHDYVTASGKTATVTLKNIDNEFSEQRIRKEMERFNKGFTNRFIPIEIPNKEDKKVRMRFTGRLITDKEAMEKFKDGKYDGEFDRDVPGLIERDLTWCDLIYMAAVEAARNRHVLITRFPIDSYFNQFPTKIHVNSTIETEPMLVRGVFYKHYPKIRQEDMGTNTSTKFIDTLNPSNLYLKGIVGDYDGDTASEKIAYSDEANEELDRYMKSKAHYIGLDGKCIRVSTNEAIQTLYNLTIKLPENKTTVPKF
jgi:hypothetical protein